MSGSAERCRSSGCVCVQEELAAREAAELSSCTATRPASLHAAPIALPATSSDLRHPTVTQELVTAEIARRSFACVQLDLAASTAVESGLAAGGLARACPQHSRATQGLTGVLGTPPQFGPFHGESIKDQCWLQDCATCARRRRRRPRRARGLRPKPLRLVRGLMGG